MTNGSGMAKGRIERKKYFRGGLSGLSPITLPTPSKKPEVISRQSIKILRLLCSYLSTNIGPHVKVVLTILGYFFLIPNVVGGEIDL